MISADTLHPETVEVEHKFAMVSVSLGGEMFESLVISMSDSCSIESNASSLFAWRLSLMLFWFVGGPASKNGRPYIFLQVFSASTKT